jgi:hypothetical protein
MKFEAVIFLVVAAVLGVLYEAAVSAIWGYYAASDIAPLGWLIALFGSGTVLFWAGLYTHEILVSLLFAAPFAFAFVAIRGLNNWPCVCLAVLASLVAGYWGAEWSNLDFGWLAQRPTWWAGMALQLFSLPVAFIVIRVIRRRRSGTQPPVETHGRAAA